LQEIKETEQAIVRDFASKKEKEQEEEAHKTTLAKSRILELIRIR
jgi:hypothetical protein